MIPKVGHFYGVDSAGLPQELTETLLERPGLRLERIISTGQATPEGEWYDQKRAEWVILLQGRASLRIESQSELIELFPGDYVDIPAHCRHRVEWTDPDEASVWLAIHYEE